MRKSVCGFSGLSQHSWRISEYVIMPNHIHALFVIRPRTSNKENHLGFLVGRFKGASAFIYGKLKREGKVPDIGE